MKIYYFFLNDFPFIYLFFFENHFELKDLLHTKLSILLVTVEAENFFCITILELLIFISPGNEFIEKLELISVALT